MKKALERKKSPVFFKDVFKAIDYGNAGPDDPYFDVATVAVISENLFSSGTPKPLFFSISKA